MSDNQDLDVANFLTDDITHDVDDNIKDFSNNNTNDMESTLFDTKRRESNSEYYR